MRLLPASQTPPGEVAARLPFDWEPRDFVRPWGKVREKTGFKNSLDASLATWTRLQERLQGSRSPAVGVSSGTPGRPPSQQAGTCDPGLTPEARELKDGPVGWTRAGWRGQWAPPAAPPRRGAEARGRGTFLSAHARPSSPSLPRARR